MSSATVRAVFRVMLALSVSACAGSTEPSVSVLPGTWVAPRLQLGCVPVACPHHSMTEELVLTEAGEFRRTIRTWGAYAGQGAADPSAYQITTGTFRTAGDSLKVTPLRLVVWDRFYGATSPERIYEPYPYGGVFDDARFRIDGNELRLSFTTYPADAPVPTTAIYTRAVPD